MSVVTAEEFYRDASEYLYDIRERLNEIAERYEDGIDPDSITPSISETIQDSSVTNISSTISIESIVKSVNGLDENKSESLIKLVDKISSLEAESVGVEALDTMSSGIESFVKRLDDLDYDKVEKFPSILRSLGLATFIFSAGLAGSIALLGYSTLENPVSLLALAGSMALFGYTMSAIGEHSSDIMKGGLAVGVMSLSLAAFSSGLIFSAGLISQIDPIGLVVLAGSMALFGYTMSAIGEHSSDIMQGGLAVGVMSLSLVAFSAGLVFSTSLISQIDPMGLVAMPLLIGGFGLLYNFMGREGTFGNIMRGALSVAVIGGTLWLVGQGLQAIQETVKEDNDFLWQFPTLLGTIGLAYAGAGAIMPLILSGAVAIGAIGGSLWAMGKGLQQIAKIEGLNEERIDTFTYSITGLIDGFGSLSLRKMLTIPLKIPIIAGMGMALIPLSIGVSKFVNDTKGFDDSEIDRLGYTIESLSNAFALAGSSEGMSKVFGFNVGRNDVQRGIDSTMKMGRNLNQLSRGLMHWRDAKFTEGDIELIGNNISGIMNVIPAIFADIGARERGSSNQIKLPMFGNVQFGLPFTKTDTELGISSTMKLGQNLTNLHKGIMSWKEGKITPDDVDVIKQNVEAVLNVIPGIFASIGANERGSGNQIKFPGNKLLGSFSFSLPFTKTDTELGIKVTQGIGKTLTDLFTGISAWKTGGKNDISGDLGSIVENIKAVLTAIPKAFKEVGDLAQEGSSFWGLIDGNMEDGVELVTKMTEPLTQLSGVMKSYASGSDAITGSRNMSRSLITLAVSMDQFSEKRIKSMKSLNKEFGDLNKNIKEHFNVIKTIPKNELESFDVYAKSLKTMSEISAKNLIEGLKMHNQHIEQRQELKMHNTNVIANASSPQIPRINQQTQQHGDKSQDASNAKVEQLLNMIYSAINDKNLLTQILSHIKNGTIKTINNDY